MLSFVGFDYAADVTVCLLLFNVCVQVCVCGHAVSVVQETY